VLNHHKRLLALADPIIVSPMKLSVIVATRNRAHAIAGCLDSIAASLANASLLDAEIVVVDSGSTDDTPAVIEAWASASPVQVQVLIEPTPGVSRARNRAIGAARANLLAFTDDDCRLSKDYVSQLLRHDAADTDLVLRGGRVELGDTSDLPISISMGPTLMRWSRKENSARHDRVYGYIIGCNVMMRRALIERVGPFDERLGSGTNIPAAEDSDYGYRAYIAGATLEYVPDMKVLHYHSRKTKATGRDRLCDYNVGNGALFAKYLFRYPKLCLPFYWDCSHMLADITSGTNTFAPDLDFSHLDKVACNLRGAARYFSLTRI
jgi:glycosyltransferase involved in cell wall biosynthesis